MIGLDNLVRPQPFGLPDLRTVRATPLRGRVAVRTHGDSRSSTPSAAGPGTCFSATHIAEEAAGLTPDQVAHSYGFDGLYKRGDLGAGQTIALFELDAYLPSDVAAYDRCIFGVSHASQVTEEPVDGGVPFGVGGGEAALDIDLVSALAPRAHIDVYEAPSNFLTVVPVTSWIDEIAAIVSQDKAPVVSMSYGFCESFGVTYAPGLDLAENTLFEQAALEGQSWFVASGDSGSETCNRDDGTTELSVADPASQPYVTSVGGTTILAPNEPPSEKVWNDGAEFGGGGGGISEVWPMPAWQSGLDVPGVKNPYTSGAPCAAPTGVACREVPDVSASADELHGDTVYLGGRWGVEGGTSAAAPKWAAVAALSNETCESEHGSQIGFANPALYQIASDPATYAEAFNDVTDGNNDVTGTNDGAYPATRGYDLASGLGTPRVTSPSGGPGLASLLCADGVSRSARPVLTSVSPDFGPYQGGTAVTITGTGLSGVTAVAFGTSSLPVTAGDVNGAGTQISIVTPASPLSPSPPTVPVGGVVVTVSGPGGASEPTPVAEFHFVDEVSSSPVPTVSFVGPTAGNAAGGDEVTIIGSGFQEGLVAGTKPTVKFGGAAASSADVTVVSDSELLVVTPPEPPPADCATYPAVAVSSVCQVEVTVTNLDGTSPTVPILPAPTGSTQVAQPPDTELVAAATEYDYAPTPAATSLDPSSLPLFPNFEENSLVTVDGSGFNFLTFHGVVIGSGSSGYVDPFITDIEPGAVQVEYEGVFSEIAGSSFPIAVATAGGTSNALLAQILQSPNLVSISAHEGSDSGGLHVSATGSDLADLTAVYFYAGANGGFEP